MRESNHSLSVPPQHFRRTSTDSLGWEAIGRLAGAILDGKAVAGTAVRTFTVGGREVAAYVCPFASSDVGAMVLVLPLGSYAPSGPVGHRTQVSCADLKRRFRLTQREAEVAVLLAARRSNKEIARELCVTTHTAWRHTEKVFGKLGISRRKDVEGVIRGGAAGGV